MGNNLNKKQNMRKVVVIMAVCAVLLGCKGQQQAENTADTAKLVPCTILNERDDMEVIAIPDRVNNISIDLFKGSYNDSLLAELMPEGSSPSAVNAFLLRSSGYYGNGKKHTVLIDAGLGSDAGGTLLRQLKKLNIQPNEIDAVCLTHLHSDHIGGLLDNGQPVFPKAEIYLSVEEFNAWNDGGPLGAQNEHWKTVLAFYANQIRLFNDRDKIVDGLITAHLAPGHTPGHTVYKAGNCLFVGDLVHAQDLQLAHPEFCARYDHEAPKAVATRKHILEKARTEGFYLCGAHCYEGFIELE